MKKNDDQIVKWETPQKMCNSFLKDHIIFFSLFEFSTDL